MAEPIKVAVSGHRGRVGSVLVAALPNEPEIDYVGGIGHGDDLAAFLHSRRPRALVDFTQAGLDGITKITSLDAPHRVYDAILRDSLLDGQPFMKSAVGHRLAKARPEDASALLEISRLNDRRVIT